MKGDRGSHGHRAQRLEQLMLEELQALFEDELSDPRLSGVRVLAVELSPDYRHARVHLALPAECERTLAERALAHATGFLRRRVAESIELKRVPELGFVLGS